MSENTASNAFRKIDVDQFNEDNFKDEETPQNAGFASINESEVLNLLSLGNAGEALKIVLSSIQARDDKDVALDHLVFRVITSVKTKIQIEGIVKTLDNDQKDLLMKFIYR